MENKRVIGVKYEELAAVFLTDRGFRIIDRNFRCKTGEIDIIAKESGYLVFIEVKYRKTCQTGMPEEAVDYRKMQKITRTAQYYMLKNQISMDMPCRFDVLAILNDNFTLIRNAFEAVF